MLKKLFILFKVVVIIHLLICLVKGILAATFVCLFSLVLFFIADKVQSKLKYSDIFQLLIYLFLFGSLLGSSIYHLYVRVWYFDIVMHGVSSFIISGLIYYSFQYFNIRMNSLVLVVFIFSFAMMIEGIWEITEFSIDRIFNTDMQKDTVITEIKSNLLSDDGESVVVKRVDSSMKIGDSEFDGYIDIGLYDTIEDMICGVGGSILYIIMGKIRKLF